MLSIVLGIIGSLGILLLGMKLLEQGMQFFLSDDIKQYLHRLMQHTYIGRLIGVIITPLLQSSSLVSLLVVSFVGAGLIGLYEALGVIAGMNVGITLVPLFLSKIGFTGLDLTTYALPLIGCSGLIMAIGRKYKAIQKISMISIGFGLILWSIQLMKGSVGGLQSYIDLSIYADYGVWVFLLVGLVSTAIVQSSLAIVVVAVSAVYSGILPLEAAIFVVMGSNIGTTTTAMLGAIGHNMTKQQVATAHFLFNVVLAVQGRLLIGIYMNVGNYFFPDDLHIQVALINFLFNLVTSIFVLVGIHIWYKAILMLFRVEEKL